MQAREAKQIILDEATSEGGLVVALRMGRDPGRERMQRLIEAIDVLAARIAGQVKVLRNVAAALYILGTEVPAQIESWLRQGAQWREGLVQKELVDLLDSVESQFEFDRSADDSQSATAPDIHAKPIRQFDDLQPSRRQDSGSPQVGAGSITIESRRKKLNTLERELAEILKRLREWDNQHRTGSDSRAA